MHDGESSIWREKGEGGRRNYVWFLLNTIPRLRDCGLLAQCSDNWGLAVPGPHWGHCKLHWGHWGDRGIFWFAPRFLFIGSLLLGRAFLLGGLVFVFVFVFVFLFFCFFVFFS